MEEVVALLAGDLEANKTEVLSRDNGLLAFATDNDRFEFHSSPLQLSWLSLVGKAGFAMSLDLCWLLRRDGLRSVAHAKRTSTGAISRAQPEWLVTGNGVLSSPRGRRSSRPCREREFGAPHRRGLGNR